MKIRPAELRDRGRILEILIATARFTDVEVRDAMELVDKANDDPAQSEYIVHVLEEPAAGPKRMVQGYVCYDPKQQGQGIGQLLLRFVENEVRRQRGRMLLIETSSKESYAPTVRFYERSNYEEISRIKDFYRLADDKVVYCKKLTPS
jgi:GNAT superfamily N-acetyltransferase